MHPEFLCFTWNGGPASRLTVSSQGACTLVLTQQLLSFSRIIVLKKTHQRRPKKTSFCDKVITISFVQLRK